MPTQSTSFYRLLIILCLLVYGWVSYQLIMQSRGVVTTQVCITKRLTNVPCPVCGSTRSLMAAAQGHITEAFILNPIGLLVAIIATLCPLWLLLDFIRKKQTLFNTYQKATTLFKKRKAWLILLVLIIINWIWSIQKGI